MTCFKTIAAAGILVSSLAAFGASASAAGMKSVDPDGDGSITMQEAHDAAAKTFDEQDKTHTGKLTAKQISPMHRAMREMARHDKDHTLDKDEYMAGVDAAFKEADPKGSGVLNKEALKTKAGRHFLSLVE